MSITIKEISITDTAYAQVWQLREDVLRQPLGMSLKNEDLSGDVEDHIFLALYGDEPTGCVLLKNMHDSTMKLRQMAVADAWQRKNIGRLLVAAAEEVARKSGAHKITLHAREVAIGFYEKLGYTITSNTFTEVGIPHKKMEKVL